MRPKASTVKNVKKYINARMQGANKQESALMAGYSAQTARTPSLIEQTKTYREIIDMVLTENASSMFHLARSLNEYVKSEAFEDMKPLEQAQLYKIITDTSDKLTPKITVKESTDSKGNKTRTAWGTNAPQLNETLRNEE